MVLYDSYLGTKTSQDIYLRSVEGITLDILYEDEDLIAINKPHGLLVHKTSMAKDATEFALQILRDQIGTKVYPAHRLDRKTSGTLLFAKNDVANALAQGLFRDRAVTKSYHAIVRGHILENQKIDYPLSNGKSLQEAVTYIEPLTYFTIPVRTDRYPTSRYTLVKIQPTTGRYHQIRKHLAHIRHPIIGDRPHGCNKQNRFWKAQHQMTTMLLHAQSLSLVWKEKKVDITAPYSMEFSKFLDFLR